MSPSLERPGVGDLRPTDVDLLGAGDVDPRGPGEGRGAVARTSRSRAGLRALATLVLACGAAFLGACRPAPAETGLTIFAAASLTDVCADLARAFPGGPVHFNFAGSNMLARQILAAPESADLFLSADREWAEELAAKDLAAEPPVEVLSNALVVVASARTEGSLERSEDLATWPFDHLAVADPEAVPAGRYARKWLEARRVGDTSLWDALASRIAPTLDVRAALALVESAPGILGIVYRTDARSSDAARILYEVPEAEQPAIAYVAVRLRPNDGSSQAQAFVEFLRSETGRRISAEHGFLAAP